MTTEQEIWKDVIGYEGLYKVSNLGQVASLHFGFKIMKLQPKKVIRGSGNYLQVQLNKPGSKVSVFVVHRLVATHFVPNPNNRPYVNHKDGVKDNNVYTNLGWVTSRENAIHAYATGLSKVSPDRSTRSNKRKLTDEQAEQIRVLLQLGVEINVISKAFKVCRNTVVGVEKTQPSLQKSNPLI